MTRRRLPVVCLLLAGPIAALAACGGAKSPVTGRPGAQQCPLTGRAPPGPGVPLRPALAVKVDNSAPARPQYGLQGADVVYEEPVEGGLTRLIAIYQCQDAARIEPIRSARIIDPQIVAQFGPHPLFAYSGGIDAAVSAVRSSTVVDIGEARAPAGTYRRDAGRSAPHNLYSSTSALYAAGRAAGAPGQAPPPVFAFGPRPAGSTGTSVVHISYAGSPVSWTWQPAQQAWSRSYPGGQTGAAAGAVVTAANVIIMSVTMYASPYVEDPTGAHENLLTLTGSGQALVLRDGVAITGTWLRPGLEDTTRYEDRSGRPIALATGSTWIELVPTGTPVTTS